MAGRALRSGLNRMLGAALLAAVLISNWGMQRTFRPQHPLLSKLLLSEDGLQDLGLIAAGFRTIAADLAWIQMLQYIGKEMTERDKADLPHLAYLTRRLLRIAPEFHRGYMLGASTLAYIPKTKRPGEALDILQEAISLNPDYMPLRSLHATIVFTQRETISEEGLAQLEETSRLPECPTVVKAFLAEVYESQKRYDDAIRVWGDILFDPAARDFHPQAKRKIIQLRQKPGTAH